MTDDLQLERTIKLKDVFSDLKTDLMEEVTMMDARVIRPANDAMEYIQPIKKTIKKRDNKRLDWERYQDRVMNYQKKMKRSDRENAAMAKAEEDMGVAAAVCASFHYLFL
jgi:amphiphysin